MAQKFGKSLVAMTPLPLDVWGWGHNWEDLHDWDMDAG